MNADFFNRLAAYLDQHSIVYQRRGAHPAQIDLAIELRVPMLLGLGSVTHHYAFYDLDRLTSPSADHAAYLRDLHAEHRRVINARFKTPRAFRLHIPDVVTIAVAAEFDQACHDLALSPAYSIIGGETHLLILLALRSATVATRGLSPRYEMHPTQARAFVERIARDLLTPTSC